MFPVLGKAPPFSTASIDCLQGAALRLRLYSVGVCYMPVSEEPMVTALPTANRVGTVGKQGPFGNLGGFSTSCNMPWASSEVACQKPDGLRKPCLPLPCALTGHSFPIIVPIPLSSHYLIPHCIYYSSSVLLSQPQGRPRQSVVFLKHEQP